MARLLLALTCLLVLSLPLQAAIDVYSFEDTKKEQRFKSLTEELRCPKCQNQNIADSNAPLAKDLRQKIYEMIRDGQSDDEVIGYLVQRYGDFVTYRPPLNAATLLLWFGPFVAIIVVAVLLRRWIRQQSRSPEKMTLSAEEQQRLHTLLDDDTPEESRS